tara:strand:- start:303 stop:533 length:231 start_codon:yes stop_codon:yes gene_type:complete
MNNWTIIISNQDKSIQYKSTIPNLNQLNLSETNYDGYINDEIMDLLDENGMWEEINDIDSWNNWGYELLNENNKSI